MSETKESYESRDNIRTALIKCRAENKALKESRDKIVESMPGIYSFGKSWKLFIKNAGSYPKSPKGERKQSPLNKGDTNAKQNP